MFQKQGEQWFLYSEHQHLGLTKSNTHLFDNRNTKISTHWTQKGRLKIHEVLENRGISPVIERIDLQLQTKPIYS